MVTGGQLCSMGSYVFTLWNGRTYGLMHAPTVERLHSTLSRTGIIILNEAVVVALLLFFILDC